ncbi:MAG: glycosyltransferase family 39 protein [Pelagibacteraceae bacterium]|nr:glycosyltransferase family 39 protein [Pelagibacteraceae bacterium]MCI5078991.1 glycosyltransferase family 39 protein [Pelagibacteraceae bacterium]
MAINRLFFCFLLTHLVIWTLIPSITNHNLPLDTIEALAWGSNLDWGFNKHPPLSALAVEIFYKIFGPQDWAYYLLSQLFVVTAFCFVFKLSKEILNTEKHALLSVLLLEGIYFYNFTTPEFNVNVCMLPFWAMTGYYAYKCLKDNLKKDYIILGIVAALGFLSKYLFFYLLVGIKIFYIFYIRKNNFKINYIIPGVIFLLILTPHLIWLTENDYITIIYGLKRTGEIKSYLDHIILPLTFIGKQIGILIPFFILLFILTKNLKTNFSFKDQNLLYLLSITILPIALIFLTSVIMGAKIRTMWMTPFYLFIGTFFIYLFQNHIVNNKLKSFNYIFIFLFLLSPFLYGYVSISQTNKRTDYKGKEIAKVVERNLIKLKYNNVISVAGNEWIAGNLCYHLKYRPKCEIIDINLIIISAEGKNGPVSFSLKELISDNYK